MKKIMNIYVFISLIVMGHQITSSLSSGSDRTPYDDIYVMNSMMIPFTSSLSSISDRMPFDDSYVMSSMIPLYGAVFNGEISIVQTLILLGADINQPLTHSGWTALDVAISQNNIPMVQELIRLGANINVKNGQSMTPLHRAVEKNMIPMVQELIRLGANINETGGYWRRTPLHHAISWNHIGMVQELIRLGADIHAPDNDGMTPLQMANDPARHTAPEIVQLLKKADRMSTLLNLKRTAKQLNKTIAKSDRIEPFPFKVFQKEVGDYLDLPEGTKNLGF